MTSLVIAVCPTLGKMGIPLLSASSPSTKIIPDSPARCRIGPSPNHNHTRQAESRLVQVPDRWGLLLCRRRLSRRGWSDCLGCHRHLAHRPIVQATGNPSQLRQLQNTGPSVQATFGGRMPPWPPSDGEEERLEQRPVRFRDGGLSLGRAGQGQMSAWDSRPAILLGGSRVTGYSIKINISYHFPQGTST